MLYKADLLLLDEPTNHVSLINLQPQTEQSDLSSSLFQLDVQSVKWLEDYLIAHDKITVLTVSHDSGYVFRLCSQLVPIRFKCSPSLSC